MVGSLFWICQDNELPHDDADVPYIGLHAEIARDATVGVIEGLPIAVVPALGELFLVFLLEAR